MSANEMISCELRGDGFYVTAYRHDGRIVASSFYLEGAGNNKAEWVFLIDGGKREFKDEQDLSVFAAETILPCIIKKTQKQLADRLCAAPIRASICEMSIGREQPKLHECMVMIWLLVMSLCASSVVAATNSFNGVSFEYDFMDDGARIIQIPKIGDYRRIKENELKIPDVINGAKVVDIGTNAFYGLSCNKHSYLTSVTNFVLPKGIKRIHAQAFGDILGLHELRFPKSLELLDEMFAARYEGVNNPNGYYVYSFTSIFDGPPPTFTNELSGAWRVPSSGVNERYAPLGGGTTAAKVYVNDLHYDEYVAQSEYRSSPYEYYSDGWETLEVGYYYRGAFLCRGMPGLRILPDSGLLYKGEKALLVCTNTNATIYYTLDGSKPQTKETQKCFKYNGPIELIHSTTIKAIAVAPEYPYYTVEEKSFAVDQPDVPIVEAVDQIPFEARDYRVQIQSSDEGAVIRYTLDGSEVTESSRVYAGVFSISDTTTVRAKVFVEGRFASEETSVTFVRHWDTVATPIIYPSDTTFANISQEVIISCETEGAKILYTTDGSDPLMNGREYTKPFTIYGSCRVRAVAVKYDWKNSAEATATFTRSESLSEAANLYGYTMETDAVVPWVVDGEVSRDGVSSVRSGAIGNNGTTWLQTSIKKAGTVSFWWKAACEEADEEEGEDGYYDYGAFLVDDVIVARIAGHDGEWHYVSHEITSGGKHTLRWEYRKDGSTTHAPDCVWLDQVQWIPADGSGYTLTTPEPVPYSWLDAYRLGVGTDYETAGNAASGKMQGGRVLQVWQDYVAGTDPTNLTSRFMAKINMVDGAPVVTWEPDLNTNGAIRTYKVYGKETLEGGGGWQYPTNSLHRFFKVTVEMP